MASYLFAPSDGPQTPTADSTGTVAVLDQSSFNIKDALHSNTSDASLKMSAEDPEDDRNTTDDEKGLLLSSFYFVIGRQTIIHNNAPSLF